jgi:hypothetical protein
MALEVTEATLVQVLSIYFFGGIGCQIKSLDFKLQSVFFF